jgi:hypothetical protein
VPSKPGEEPAGKELIAPRTFCSLTIKEKSPGLKTSGKKSSRDGEGCFFLIFQFFKIWLIVFPGVFYAIVLYNLNCIFPLLNISIGSKSENQLGTEI